MEKRSYFISRFRDGWPEPEEIAPLFLAPLGERWFFETGNDSAGLTAEDGDGAGRVAVHLDIWAHPELGVQLTWRKWGGGHKETYHSRGDLLRLGEHVRSLHDTLLPVGLFIPWEQAWEAVRDFIETDGQRPESVAWLEESKLPAGTFPSP
ncbi:Imm1 family immunity protein [Parvibaculum sp.]|uniref:Imm1 family immunity protein n=1 Tax=Parvibaculum sp. TaxID=2024848 RepID=UPI00273529F0|nr:Imm1 family immunity protein [Parvibaculum sp.]MDP3327924.1 Imm1 family immunity protein [Parvibaculum sp.]